MSRLTLTLAAAALTFFGCNHDSPQTQTIQGQINLSDYNLNHPQLLVESTHASYVAPVAASGRFSVSVPAGSSYRLTLTDRTASGALSLVSRVLWSAQGHTFVWGLVRGTSTNLGLIRPISAAAAAPAAGLQAQSDQGENDDSQCDENDDAQGDEQGPNGAAANTCTSKPPASHPDLCKPTTCSDSKGDRDDDADEDNNAQGNDDRDDQGENGAACVDGGTASDNDNSQGNNNNQGENEDNGGGCKVHIPACTGAGDGGTPPPSGNAGTPPSGNAGTPPSGNAGTAGDAGTPPPPGMPSGPSTTGSPDMSTIVP
jgi:hypothetical protein